MSSIDEVEEKIKTIIEDINQGKSYRYLEKTYGLKPNEASDFKDMTPLVLKHIRESIEFIKHERDNGIQTRKISSDLSFGRGIVSYVLKELGYDIRVRPKRVDNSAIELEKIWRAYKSGESIQRIAAVFGHSIEDSEVIVSGVNKRIEKRRAFYKNRENLNIDEEREKLKRYLRVSDDVIDYILKGTPIKNIENGKQGNSEVGEDGRDEL